MAILTSLEVRTLNIYREFIARKFSLSTSSIQEALRLRYGYNLDYEKVDQIISDLKRRKIIRS